MALEIKEITGLVDGDSARPYTFNVPVAPAGKFYINAFSKGQIGLTGQNCFPVASFSDGTSQFFFGQDTVTFSSVTVSVESVFYQHESYDSAWRETEPAPNIVGVDNGLGSEEQLAKYVLAFPYSFIVAATPLSRMYKDLSGLSGSYVQCGGVEIEPYSDGSAQLRFIRDGAVYFTYSHPYGFRQDSAFYMIGGNIFFCTRSMNNYLDVENGEALYVVGNIRYGTQDETKFYNTVSLLDMTSYLGVTKPTPPPKPDPPLPEQKEDPLYNEATASQIKGGNGSFDFGSDTITVPDLPSLENQPSAANFFTIYIPTAEQLENISKVFWGTDTNLWAELSKTYPSFDPINMVLSFNAFPFRVPSDLVTQNMYIGGKPLGVACNGTRSQYISWDFGEVDYTTPLRGNFLDYEPYTNISLRLPFVGQVSIPASEVFGHKVGLVRRVDILTGCLCYYVTCDGANTHVFTGCCAVSVPISSNFRGSGIINMAIAAASAAAKVGLPLASSFVSEGALIVDKGSALPPIAASAGGAANQMRNNPAASLGGSMGESLSLLEDLSAAVIIDTCVESIPSNYSAEVGNTLNVYRLIGDFTGYLEVSAVHVEGIACLAEEMDEIESLLKGGVFL